MLFSLFTPNTSSQPDEVKTAIKGIDTLLAQFNQLNDSQEAIAKFQSKLNSIKKTLFALSQCNITLGCGHERIKHSIQSLWAIDRHTTWPMKISLEIFPLLNQTIPNAMKCYELIKLPTAIAASH